MRCISIVILVMFVVGGVCGAETFVVSEAWDVEDAALLDRIFSQNEIAAVMHFAAFALVGESVENPLRNRLADGGWHLYPGLHPCQRPDPGPPTGPRDPFDRRGQ